ncbi:MAG: hypothetical protein EOP11_00665 [Proteobacteria bacterium]|nr:MAG: hypothetical protein EOP11_00665 [Pseudomonadota bacterium]
MRAYPFAFAIAITLFTPIGFAAESDLPNAEALTKWREQKGSVTDRTDLTSYPRLKVACANQKLFPSHPQQDLKLYHRFNTNQYDHFKLAGTDEPCLISQKAAPKGRAPLCLKADIAYDALISDTYEDACGQAYRGFREVKYLGKNESMGTLLSAGRTVFQREGSSLENDMALGHTYGIPVADFAIIGALLPGDEAAIQRLKEKAKASTIYDEETHTYRQAP